MDEGGGAVRRLYADDPDEQAGAIKSIREQGDERAVGALSAYVSSDASPYLRARALAATVEVASKPADLVEPLLRGLDGPEQVQEVALDALSDLEGVEGESPATRLVGRLETAQEESESEEVRALLSAISGVRGREALAAVRRRQWNDESLDSVLEYRELAVYERATGGPEPLSVADLDHPDPHVRRDAIDDVVAGDDPPIDAVVDLLADPHPAVRLRAVEAVGEHGDPDHLLELAATLEDDVDDVRAATVDAIRDATHPGTAKTIVGLLKTAPASEASTYYDLLFADIDHMGDLPGLSSSGIRRSFRDNARENLSSDEPIERARAADRLAILGTSEDVDDLLDARDANAAVVREHAAFALGHLGINLNHLWFEEYPRRASTTAPDLGGLDDDRVRMALREQFDRESDPDALAAIVDALGMLGAIEAAPAICAHLDDESPAIRRQSALALARLGHADCLDDLVGLLTEDPQPAVRAAAATAVGELYEADGVDEHDVLPALRTAAVEAESADVRARAVEALARTGESRVRTTIREVETVDPDEDVRDRSTWAQGELTRQTNRAVRWIRRGFGALLTVLGIVVLIGGALFQLVLLVVGVLAGLFAGLARHLGKAILGLILIGLVLAGLGLVVAAVEWILRLL